MTTPSDQDLRRMLAEATALPWQHGPSPHQIDAAGGLQVAAATSWNDVLDRNLIVAAVNALPAHMDEIARLKGEMEKERERAERAEAGRQEAQERLNNSRDWHQQRYNRLRKWVDEEVKPLSEEVHHRYYAIVANGAASPAESADWSGTLHSMGLQLDAARADADRLAGLLGEVVEAYAGRFEVPGRGLVGPIDPEIEQARSALAGRGGRKEGGG